MRLLTPIKNSYTYLHWLTKKYKWLKIPNLYLIDDEDLGFSGAFQHKIPNIKSKIIMINDNTLMLNEDSIIINLNSNSDIDDIPATIAHEFRHLYQWYTEDVMRKQEECGFNSGVYLQKLNSMDLSFKQKIHNYYNDISYEMDALIFENRVCKTDFGSWCLGVANNIETNEY